MTESAASYAVSLPRTHFALCASSCRCRAYRGELAPQHTERVVARDGKPVSVWEWTHVAAHQSAAATPAEGMR